MGFPDFSDLIVRFVANIHMKTGNFYILESSCIPSSARMNIFYRFQEYFLFILIFRVFFMYLDINSCFSINVFVLNFFFLFFAYGGNLPEEDNVGQETFKTLSVDKLKITADE